MLTFCIICAICSPDPASLSYAVTRARYSELESLKDWENPLADTFERKMRSSIMRAVKSENTTTEMGVRRAVHKMGFRYRLHVKDLPGKPDMVFPRFKTVAFINGCFWHWHGCPRTRMPKSNVQYWKNKIDRNVQRDKTNHDQLRRQGWTVILIWECDLDAGVKELANHLSSLRKPG